MNPSFNEVVFNLTDIPDTSIMIPPGVLFPGNTYYWRVRGSDSAGPGPWSETWSFSTGASNILNLTAMIQGFYDPASDLMVPDTVTVYLRNIFVPYSIVDSSKGMLDPFGSGSFIFSNVTDGENYYLVVRHRNSIETWSAEGQVFSSGLLSYDFTSSSEQAFGNNQNQIDVSPIRFGIFSGDVNQNGFVNLQDLIITYNGASSFASGYNVTDVNGDNLTDLNDLVIVYNNVTTLVHKITP